MTYRFIPAVAVALTTLCGVVSDSRQCNAQEYIVSQQVVSDVKVEGGFYDGQYAGDSSSQGMSSGDTSGSCPGCSGGSGRLGGLGDGLRGGGGYAGDMAAGTVYRGYGQPDLFYNYYTQGNSNGVNAQMYLSPLPVPPNVGHTFMTYQPFYPEEMLYWHKNKFHNNYDNGRGLNRTRAVYYSPPVRQAASNIYWNYLRIPR